MPHHNPPTPTLLHTLLTHGPLTTLLHLISGHRTQRPVPTSHTARTRRRYVRIRRRGSAIPHHDGERAGVHYYYANPIRREEDTGRKRRGKGAYERVYMPVSRFGRGIVVTRGWGSSGYWVQRRGELSKEKEHKRRREERGGEWEVVRRRRGKGKRVSEEREGRLRGMLSRVSLGGDGGRGGEVRGMGGSSASKVKAKMRAKSRSVSVAVLKRGNGGVSNDEPEVDSRRHRRVDSHHRDHGSGIDSVPVGREGVSRTRRPSTSFFKQPSLSRDESMNFVFGGAEVGHKTSSSSRPAHRHRPSRSPEPRNGRNTTSPHPRSGSTVNRQTQPSRTGGNLPLLLHAPRSDTNINDGDSNSASDSHDHSNTAPPDRTRENPRLTVRLVRNERDETVTLQRI
ncbi:hypothetical protein BU24DRAFT_455489 [Aaosphaeria arxii CBS 175.79]|uniref:Uncharacterized protein n=1 Tax=Aaosphaeria arxii CBS 175.79 TaxID=1450172 RepID=A0A6A5X9A5_9PLEO|nr:uncharacterized protein BU24DRAFT_455489 [Aaosphaeria arxii CBS 175.79]KAF2009523.1 hypothetical protein BU24DRAFT_455489 [Aaosphaeria arxii CBS 175.79]